MTFDADGKPMGLQADLYKFWLYRQIRKRFDSGEIYHDDSLQHRHFSDELVSMDERPMWGRLRKRKKSYAKTQGRDAAA